jgi:hypothetical protein
MNIEERRPCGQGQAEPIWGIALLPPRTCFPAGTREPTPAFCLGIDKLSAAPSCGPFVSVGEEESMRGLPKKEDNVGKHLVSVRDRDAVRAGQDGHLASDAESK